MRLAQIAQIDFSSNVQLDLSATVLLFAYLAMSDHYAVIDKGELECHAVHVHWHDQHYFWLCAYVHLR